MELGGKLVSVVTETQAKAVANAQKAYEQVKNSNQTTIQSINDLLSGACSLFSGRKSGKESNASLSADAHDLKDYYLYGQYGFDEETIRILKKLRKAVDEFGFSDPDWFFAQAIGGMQYGPELEYSDSYAQYIKENMKWGATAGRVYGPLEMLEPSARLQVLGLSEQEINCLIYNVRVQNAISSGTPGTWDKKYLNKIRKAYGEGLTEKEAKNIWEKNYKAMSGKGDYAHYSITTAALNVESDYTDLGRWAAKWYIRGDEDDLRDMSGWLGDATLGDVPSFKNDDYISDLDAENVTSIMKKDGIRYEEAVEKYHRMLNSGETRASLFLKDNSYKEVEQEILKRANKKNLKDLKKDKNYQDTYNFLMSLKDNRNEMGVY